VRIWRGQLSSLKQRRAWFPCLLLLAALLLSLWQAPLSRVAHRQAGTREFLSLALHNQPLSAGSRLLATMDASDLESAASQLRRTNIEGATRYTALNSYRTLGVVDLAADNPAGAQSWLARRLAIAPTDLLAHFYLGEAYLRLGDTQAAIKEWEMAGAQNQLLDLAKESMSRGMHAEALAALDAVLRLDPTNVDARWFAAEIWREQGDLERALELLQEMIALAPQSLGPRQRAAEIWVEQGDVERALEMCEELISIAPAQPNGYVSGGVILFNEGQYERAITFFEKALQLSPPSPHWILVRLGRAYAALGRWTEAIDAYEQAIQEDPTQHWDYALMGDAQCQAGHPEEALSYYEQAVAWGNQSSRVRQVADYIARTGDCLPDPQFH
jgi:tetratricopeptide (TPR) repeat protein